MLKAVEKSHWVALISIVVVFAVVDAFIYGIGFGSMLLDGIASDNIPAILWSLIGAVAWVTSVILGGACVGELLGRGWRRFKNK